MVVDDVMEIAIPCSLRTRFLVTVILDLKKFVTRFLISPQILNVHFAGREEDKDDLAFLFMSSAQPL